MGIRNSLLGVGSAGITTETGIIIGAAVVKIVLVVLSIVLLGGLAGCLPPPGLSVERKGAFLSLSLHFSSPPSIYFFFFLNIFYCALFIAWSREFPQQLSGATVGLRLHQQNNRKGLV